jgi:2-polyprenyl-6-methoxyphenol hydroxylase-like FAD-dependent oxidoreductase
MREQCADVVVVGAGPTGLMLAMELALGGVKVTVLERLLEPDDTIKAGALGALAAEALERRGLGGAMDAEERVMSEAMAAMMQRTGAAGSPPSWRKIGGHFAGLFLIDQTRQREPERRLRGVRQQALERILDERARSLGIDVRRGHEVIGFREHGEGVEVDGRGPPGEFTQRCEYLVGCDGGRSLVRKRGGFDFPGTESTLTGHQAIVELDCPERLLPLGWRRTPTGMLAYGPVPGRILTVEFDAPPAGRDLPVTLAEVQCSLRRVSGADITVTAMKSATRFTDNARQATTYRRSRVLLAGDAAHVHSPFGGQGLNLGLLDAVNLGWKLAAVVRGRAPEDLLDSYTAERHPVGARVLVNTRAQVALMRPDVLTTALRDIITDIMILDEGNRFFGEMMSGVTTRYDLNSEHPQVGRLCRNLILERSEGETDLYSLMRHGHGVLIDAGGGAAAGIADAWAARVQMVRVPCGTSLLVRPDGCVAWASDDEQVDGLDSALLRWFGPSG